MIRHRTIAIPALQRRSSAGPPALQRRCAPVAVRRGPRVSTRKVKSPISRYNERHDDGRPGTSHTVTGLDITIIDPQPELPTASHDDRHTPPTDRRRQRVLNLLHADPDRHWHTRDLARHLGDITLGTMHRQLSRWAHQGLIHKAGPAINTSQRNPSNPPPPARIR